jgi:hypothetical protein
MRIQHDAILRRIGGSLHFIVPVHIVRSLGLAVGDEVHLEGDENGFRLQFFKVTKHKTPVGNGDAETASEEAPAAA